MMRRLVTHLRKLAQPLIWPLYRWYLSRPRWYQYQGIHIRLLPTVFHPGWLVSTKILLEFAMELDSAGKRVLELGAGSGLIGLSQVRKGAMVTASDLNPMAIRAMKESSLKNNVPLTLIESDLFDKIPLQHFDFIFINPPYYPRQPKNDWERGFYCGPDFDFFRGLFTQIKPFMGPATRVYMILNEYCALAKIMEIAESSGIVFNRVLQKRKAGEWQYIFEMSNRPFDYLVQKIS